MSKWDFVMYLVDALVITLAIWMIIYLLDAVL